MREKRDREGRASEQDRWTESISKRCTDSLGPQTSLPPPSSHLCALELVVVKQVCLWTWETTDVVSERETPSDLSAVTSATVRRSRSSHRRGLARQRQYAFGTHIAEDSVLVPQTTVDSLLWLLLWGVGDGSEVGAARRAEASHGWSRAGSDCVRGSERLQ